MRSQPGPRRVNKEREGAVGRPRGDGVRGFPVVCDLCQVLWASGSGVRPPSSNPDRSADWQCYLSKLLNLAKSQFPQLQNRDDNHTPSDYYKDIKNRKR